MSKLFFAIVIMFFITPQSWGKTEQLSLAVIAQDLQWDDYHPQSIKGAFLGKDIHYIFGPDLKGSRYSLIESRKHPKLRELKNKILTTLLKTPTGSKICQAVGQGEQNLIQYKFGVDDDYYALIDRSCSLGFSRLFQPKSHSIKMDPLFWKEYYFIFTDAPQVRFSSWTTRDRATFILINPNTDSWESVTAAFAHEIAMVLDNMANPTHSAVLEHALKEKYSTEPQTACDLYNAISSQTMRWAFNILRATSIENTILREANIAIENDEGPPETESCERQLIRSLDTASQIEVFEARKYNNRFLPRCPLTSEGFNLLSFATLISQEKVPGSQQSFCELLSTSDFNPKNWKSYDQDMSPGPRPRIGGGTGFVHPSDQKESSEKTLELQRQRLMEIYSNGIYEKKIDAKIQEKFPVPILKEEKILPKNLQLKTSF